MDFTDKLVRFFPIPFSYTFYVNARFYLSFENVTPLRLGQTILLVCVKPLY